MVTALSLCQRCPRLLAFQEQGEKNAWQAGSAGKKKVSYGSLFHSQIVGRFHSDAADGESPCRQALIKVFAGGQKNLNKRLNDLVREHYFSSFLMTHSKKLTSLQVQAIARATTFWVECLADFLLDIPSLFSSPEERLNAVFHSPEKTLKGVWAFPDGQVLKVTGRYDALLFNPDAGEAVLFEFKGFKMPDVTVGLSQTLLYAWLVSSAAGIVPAVKLIGLEDDAPCSFASGDVKTMMGNLPYLFETARQVLEKRLPLPQAADSGLCSLCPYDARCDQEWGERSSLPTQDEDFGEGLERMTQLLSVLQACNVYVSDEGCLYSPAFIRLKVKPDIKKGARVQKIEGLADDLRVHMGLATQPLIQAQNGYVSVDIPRKERQGLSLTDLLKKGEHTRPKSEAAFPLGLDIEGKALWVDLADPMMTSILIGGTSGSGKSVLLRSIVISLLLCAPRDSVNFSLIDPKRVTFTDMKNLRCLEEGSLLLDTGAALEALSSATEEMERRYVLMENMEVSDITAFNAKAANRLKRRVILIDEYADMIITKQTREALETSVQRICQKGRAAGIHLILATQRPDAKVVTGVIKANLQLRVALKVTSQTNSQIILGEGVGQAQSLLGNGDMLVGGSIPIQRLQGPLASTDLLGREFFTE
ncbi:MAG: PD-(D/E)XK nuclease family protein [Synergistaceae bacterium]|nr:PD-(D/E)XK nuclease family protein [Synergistaceae bacterium]